MSAAFSSDICFETCFFPKLFTYIFIRMFVCCVFSFIHFSIRWHGFAISPNWMGHLTAGTAVAMHVQFRKKIDLLKNSHVCTTHFLFLPLLLLMVMTMMNSFFYLEFLPKLRFGSHIDWNKSKYENLFGASVGRREIHQWILKNVSNCNHCSTSSPTVYALYVFEWIWFANWLLFRPPARSHACLSNAKHFSYIVAQILAHRVNYCLWCDHVIDVNIIHFVGKMCKYAKYCEFAIKKQQLTFILIHLFFIEII